MASDKPILARTPGIGMCVGIAGETFLNMGSEHRISLEAIGTILR